MYNQFQQTHFIGVLPPEPLALTLEESRRYMRSAYGCKSGQSTPVHVTLVPPFRLEAGTDALLQAVARAVQTDGRPLRFMAQVSGYGAFGERTLFAAVAASPEWTALRDTVLGAVLRRFPGCTKKDRRPFQPHLTVANRDIPAGACPRALTALAELPLEERFAVDNVAVFERYQSGWQVAGEIPLEG